MSRDHLGRGSTPAKRQSAPISASAFSFTLPTAKTPAKPLKPLATATSFASPSTHISTRSTTTPSRAYNTSHNDIKVETPHHQTPVSLASLPSPGIARPRTPPTAGPSRPTKRLHEWVDEASPFRPRVKSETQDVTGGVPIGTLPGWGRDVAQGLAEKKRSEFVDEGVGVSPRRTKGIKYIGKGAPPPSIQLSHLLSSANSSLHLFYTSLQQTLHPTRNVQRNSIAPKLRRDHLRTAPLRLSLGQAISQPTHQGTMFRCTILRGGNGVDSTTEVQVIFQPVPNDCPKLGTDPRAVSQMEEGSWEVGVWEPWTEVLVPACSSEARDGSEGAISEVGEDWARFIFATRYLISR